MVPGKVMSATLVAAIRTQLFMHVAGNLCSNVVPMVDIAVGITAKPYFGEPVQKIIHESLADYDLMKSDLPTDVLGLQDSLEASLHQASH